MTITTLGIDLAKSVFQLHGVNAQGAVVLQKKLRRGAVLTFLGRLEPCLIGIEACATSHYWAREIAALGHTVRLIPPSYVKPYVKRQKNDAADAEAICEAVTRPNMRFVAVKTEEQQGVLVLHRSRDLLMRQRTMILNAIRAHFAEFGIVTAQGPRKVEELVIAMWNAPEIEQRTDPQKVGKSSPNMKQYSGNMVFAVCYVEATWRRDLPANGGMGSLYRSKHELVFVFKNGKSPHINNIELGRHGRNRTNVWDYPGVNSFSGERAQAQAMHPTVKPLALVADAILDCSNRNGLILDIFAGSGTTILAAERVGRRGRGIELDPRYVDVAIRRWQEEAGEDAIEGATGLPYSALRKQRLHEAATDCTAANTAPARGQAHD